jgi:hypothetical protein
MQFIGGLGRPVLISPQYCQDFQAARQKKPARHCFPGRHAGGLFGPGHPDGDLRLAFQIRQGFLIEKLFLPQETARLVRAPQKGAEADREDGFAREEGIQHRLVDAERILRHGGCLRHLVDHGQQIAVLDPLDKTPVEPFDA